MPLLLTKILILNQENGSVDRRRKKGWTEESERKANNTPASVF